jgi:hypothetical protein
MKPSGTDKNKRHTLQWWMVPKCDEFGQWWWGYQKVYINVLPEEEKLAWLKSMGYDSKEEDDSL